VGTRSNLSRIIPLVVAVIVMVALWFLPDVEFGAVDAGSPPVEAYRAEVLDPAPPAPHPDDPFSGYGEIIVRPLEGPYEGEEIRAFVTLTSTDTGPEDFAAGDEVVLTFTDDVDGIAFAAVSERWRLPILGLLVLSFAVAMVLVGGWQGFRALVALGLTVVLVAKILVPAILGGVAPVPLAVVLASIVTMATITLSEGLTRVSLVAILGTVGGLMITALLSGVVSSAGAFSGTPAGDLAYVALESGAQLDMRGILLAAIILGAVGVLDDVTVTQAATVEEFAAKSHHHTRLLWARGIRVGRSHIAATTNTLFMAYVGASLPALIFLATVAEPTLLTLNREVLALEIVRTLVGSIGIILAMPLTTLIAALAFGHRSASASEAAT
jgi:uncharacterized membrane protein